MVSSFSVAVILAAAIACNTASPVDILLEDQVQLKDTEYGGIYFAGGSNGSFLTTVEGINPVKSLPPLPAPLDDNSLSIVDSILYSCGGYYDGAVKDCYTLDISSSKSEWQNSTFDLPTPMHLQTANVVGSDIWFIYGGYIYDVDTKTGKFESNKILNTTITYGHCTVQKEELVYIIGAGYGFDEVWVMDTTSNVSIWDSLFNFPTSKQYSGCVLFDDEIYVTGGIEYPNDVDIIDLNSPDVANFTSSKLQVARYFHSSFILNDKPAVAGGYNFSSGYLSSIETYDEATNTWSLEKQELSEKKLAFGTAQLLKTT